MVSCDGTVGYYACCWNSSGLCCSTLHNIFFRIILGLQRCKRILRSFFEIGAFDASVEAISHPRTHFKFSASIYYSLYFLSVYYLFWVCWDFRLLNLHRLLLWRLTFKNIVHYHLLLLNEDAANFHAFLLNSGGSGVLWSCCAKILRLTRMILSNTHKIIIHISLRFRMMRLFAVFNFGLEGFHYLLVDWAKLQVLLLELSIFLVKQHLHHLLIH